MLFLLHVINFFVCACSLVMMAANIDNREYGWAFAWFLAAMLNLISGLGALVA